MNRPFRFTLIASLIVSVSARAAEPVLRAPPGFKDRSGFQELIFGQAANGYFFGYLLGLTLANPTSQEEFEDEDGRRIAGGALLGLGAGLGISALATRGEEIKTGDVVLLNFASMEWGLSHGLLLPYVFGAEDVRAYGAAGMAGDALGLTAALLINRRVDLTPGQAALLSLGYEVGAGMGLFGSLAVASDDGEVNDDNTRAAVGITLAAADLALAAAVLGRNRFEMDRRRVQWLGLGAYIGGVAGFGMGFLVAPDSPRTAFGLTAGLIPAGMLIAYLVTDNLDLYKRRVAAVDSSVVTLRDGRVHTAVPVPRFSLLPTTNPAQPLAAQMSVGLLEGTW